LATNKHCSLVLEKLLRASSPEQLKSFFRGLYGYFNFLGFNRFSTHVLETLLSLLGPVIAAEVAEGQTHGVAVDDDEPMQNDGDGEVEPDPAAGGRGRSVCELIQQLCDELGDSWLTLMATPGSTHVVRALLAVLTGREVATSPLAGVNPRNRKKKKKKHKRTNMPGDALPAHTTIVTVGEPKYVSYCYVMPAGHAAKRRTSLSFPTRPHCHVALLPVDCPSC